MRTESPCVIKLSIFWVITVGSVSAFTSTALGDGNLIEKIASLAGVIITWIGGAWATHASNPKIFHFTTDNWIEITGDHCILTIPAKMHKKGRWPTYKILDFKGETFHCDREYILENGDIKLCAVSGSLIPSGRVLVK